MKIYLLSLILLLVSCSNSNERKISIYSQWHLPSEANTLDIASSKKAKQFNHQIKLYETISKEVEAKTYDLIVQEGCEGEITPNFKDIYYGWSMDKLIEFSKKASFDSIMVPVPMKIKAKLGSSIKVICGERSDLIKKQNLAFSDVRGNVGFYSRLKETRYKDRTKFERFKKSYLEMNSKDRFKGDVVELARSKTLSALNIVEKTIERRNASIVENVRKQKAKDVALVIGALHIPDLKTKFLKAGYEVVVIEDEQANKELQLLDPLEQLKEILSKKEKMALTYFQVIDSFDIKKFPFKKMLKRDQVFSDSEWNSMEKILKANQIDEKVLLSDYDEDGIRDFTLSQGDGKVIISAEDSDWDQDGTSNLLDHTVGASSVANPISEPKISNKLGIQSYSIEDFKKKNKERILSTYDESMELLVLKVYDEIKKVYKKKLKINHINATQSDVQYGEKVFFSYIPQSKTMEIYTSNLLKYLDSYKIRNFKGVEFSRYLNDVVIPILIHSLSPEMGHASELNELAYAKNFGWSWKESEYSGNYLYEARNPSKRIESFKNNTRFRGKKFGQWMSEKLVLEKERKQLKDPKFKQTVQQSIWYTGIKSSESLYWLSLLHKYKTVSYYAFKSPSEWFAENFAACVFQHFYPKSMETQESLKYEWLIGLYPKAAPKNLCSDVWR